MEYFHRDLCRKSESVRSHAIRRFTEEVPNLGNKRYCPVCRTPSKRFVEYGIVPRTDAKCIQCGALERHRFVWLYFERITNLFDGGTKAILHIAPERTLQSLFKHYYGSQYLSADLYDSRAMVRMDITNVKYAKETFDVIYCSHVLEHVSDDIKAIGEFHRILQPDGWAILLVPITAKKTFEDSSITDPEERLKVFGQEDHVRRYGPDFMDRLREVGFEVKVTTPSDFLTKEERVYMGITDAAGEIFHCTK